MPDWEFVTPRLATGAQVVDGAFVEELAQAGITHVLDLTDAEDDHTLLAEHPQIKYRWNPTADDGQPKNPSWFGASLEFALPMFEQPRTKLYTHCSAGINRGPSTAYCVMRALGWTEDEAYNLIKSQRPQARMAYRADADRAVRALGYE